MPAHHDPRSYLLAAQLNELSMRERVSSAVSVVAVLTVAWVHSGVITQSRVVGWMIGMCLLQVLRNFIARKHVDPDESFASLRLRRAIRVGINVINGMGWGGIWFLLDSRQLDFIFMFKFGALAAALGVTVNVLGVVMSSYVGFASALILLTIGYLVADAPFLLADQRFSLLSGVVAYYTVLMVVARNTSNLTRVALEQGLEREMALAEAQASHRREQRLRERLQQESKQLESANQQLNEAHDRLVLISRTDALTGIANRRHLIDELERAVHGFRRYGIDFSLVLLMWITSRKSTIPSATRPATWCSRDWCGKYRWLYATSIPSGDGAGKSSSAFCRIRPMRKRWNVPSACAPTSPTHG